MDILKRVWRWLKKKDSPTICASGEVRRTNKGFGHIIQEWEKENPNFQRERIPEIDDFLDAFIEKHTQRKTKPKDITKG